MEWASQGHRREGPDRREEAEVGALNERDQERNRRDDRRSGVGERACRGSRIRGFVERRKSWPRADMGRLRNAKGSGIAWESVAQGVADEAVSGK